MLVTALLWVFQKIAPITSVIGALVLFSGEFEGYELIVGAVLQCSDSLSGSPLGVR